MSDQANKNLEKIRRQHNIDLIRRMRAGDNLTSFDSKASWFPPRPIIKKDAKELARLYSSESKNELPNIAVLASAAHTHLKSLPSEGFDEAG